MNTLSWFKFFFGGWGACRGGHMKCKGMCNKVTNRWMGKTREQGERLGIPEDLMKRGTAHSTCILHCLFPIPSPSPLSPSFCKSLLSCKQQVLLVFTDGLDDDLEKLKEASECLVSKGKGRALPCGGRIPPAGLTVLQISRCWPQVVGPHALEADMQSPSS